MWTVVLGVVVLLIVLYYRYMTRDYDVFKKMGVSGPKPLPILGNFLDVLKTGMREWDVVNFKKYGKVYGEFLGQLTTLVVAEPSMLRQILVKDFDKFVNRRTFSFRQRPPFGCFLTVLKGDHWKHVRNMLTPAFTSGKLKGMTSLITQASDSMVDHLRPKVQNGEDIELKTHIGAYTMDVIASTVFGLNVDSQKDPSNAFVTNAQKLLSVSIKSPIFILMLFFPFLMPIIIALRIPLMSKKITDFFLVVTDHALHERKQDKSQKYRDLLQLMVDSERDIDDTSNGKANTDVVVEENGDRWSRTGLLRTEIQAQSMLFCIAGYDTTATTVALTLYNLALHLDCQTKAHEEVDAILANHPLGYETAADLQYIDMCINETLRLYPPALRFDRTCVQDTDVGGLKISKGQVINVPIHSIHQNPDLWPEPERFDPERFTAENSESRDPFSFLPFGYGPRHCIGMRLAQLEARIGVASVLKEFTILRCDKTMVPLKFTSNGLLEAEGGIWIKMEARK